MTKRIDWVKIQNFIDSNPQVLRVEVAKNFGFSPMAITKAEARGAIYWPIGVSILDQEEAQKLYDSGFTIREVAKKLNVTTATLLRSGLKTRTKHESLTLFYQKNDPKTHSLKTKDKLSKLMVDRLLKKPFYSKRTIYNGILLDSSYELILAKDLDKHQIKWIRPSSISYIDDQGQTRRYIPDFFLPDYRIYLDPKNPYLMRKDRRKIELVSNQNSIKVLMLSKDQLCWSEIQKIL
jgi:hypothetical protein